MGEDVVYFFSSLFGLRVIDPGLSMGLPVCLKIIELDFVLKLMKLVNCNSIGWDQKKSYAGEDDDEDSDEDDDEDSDEGCFVANGYRKMTKEEHEDYNNQINENMVISKCGILFVVYVFVYFSN